MIPPPAVVETRRNAPGIPRNSIGGKQLRADAVTGAKVKDRSLRAKDFAPRQLPSGAPGAPGATGPTGAAGPQGEIGIEGVSGVVGKVTVYRIDFPIPDEEETTVNVKCPLGTTAIGGGSSLDVTNAADLNLTVSRPFRTVGDPPAIGETFHGWRIVFSNPRGGTPQTFGSAYAVCAQA